MYIPRYVIDTMVINAKGGVAGMNELERLHDLKAIEIFCTSTSNVEFRPVPLQEEKSRKYRRIGSAFASVQFEQTGQADATWGAVSRQSRMEEIHSIVFGTRYTSNHKERTNLRDVLHLDQCWSNMIDVFITEDKTILNSRKALFERGFDFRIYKPEECVEFTRQCFCRWYGTARDRDVTNAINDLSRPIILGSNLTAPVSISIGEERPILAVRLGKNSVLVEALFRDQRGARLLNVRPGQSYEFHQRTVQISGTRTNCDVGIKLGTKYYDMCSIGSRGEDQPAFWSSSDTVLLAAFVARSGHVVFYAGIFRDSHGEVRAIIHKEHLKLIGASLRY